MRERNKESYLAFSTPIHKRVMTFAVLYSFGLFLFLLPFLYLSLVSHLQSEFFERGKK